MTVWLRTLALPLVASLVCMLAACSKAESGENATGNDSIAAIEAPEGQDWLDIVTISEENGYILGNPQAPIKLVEYASHTCAVCAQFVLNGVGELKENYVSTGTVSYELRNLIRDPIDLAIATLVRCGKKESMQPLSDQGWLAFGELMQGVQANAASLQSVIQLPANRRFVAIGERTGLIAFFSARGLNADQARACLADNAKIEALAASSQEQATRLKITGTPTFMLNGRRLDVNLWRDLEPLLQRAGARSAKGEEG